MTLMFLAETEICNHADDATIYEYGPETENVTMHLKWGALRIAECFPNNSLN